MGGLKTRPSGASVERFLASIDDEGRRRDARKIAKLLREVTGSPPKLWGPSIVGYGSYHYRYASGREGDWFEAGFSPRRENLVVYVMSGFAPHADALKRLGRHSKGKSCLYLKRLDDVDLGVLRELVTASVARVRERGACSE